MLHTQGLKTLDDIRTFLDGSKPLEVKAPQREAAYELIARTLRRFAYTTLGKADKGLLRRYLGKVTVRISANVTARSGDRDRCAHRSGAGVDYSDRAVTISQIGLGLSH